MKSCCFAPEVVLDIGDSVVNSGIGVVGSSKKNHIKSTFVDLLFLMFLFTWFRSLCGSLNNFQLT